MSLLLEAYVSITTRLWKSEMGKEENEPEPIEH
jgi:hypothetical protein